MQHFEGDLDTRRAVWCALQDLWMDTDPEPLWPGIVRVCADSRFSLDELERIFWDEVRPALAGQLRGPAPEWRGLTADELEERIRTHARPTPRLLRFGPDRALWRRLRSAVRAAR